jgi:hypothetical protein
MNKTELESLLKKARLPEISGESLEMFPRRIVAGLKRNDPPPRPARSFSPHLAWALGLAACAVIAFATGHWRGRMETERIPAADSLASAKLIHEMMAMFPNQIRAIVQDEDGGLKLVLSDHSDVPASPPLYVRISDGKHSSSFVTFSGQEIQVAGQNITVLADARGGIILAGSQFVWSSRERTSAAGHLKIEARNLGTVTM